MHRQPTIERVRVLSWGRGGSYPRLHVRICRDERFCLRFAEDREGGGKAVAGHAVRRDDGRGEMIGEAEAAVRIDDVRIMLAADLNELLRVA